MQRDGECRGWPLGAAAAGALKRTFQSHTACRVLQCVMNTPASPVTPLLPHLPLQSPFASAFGFPSMPGFGGAGALGRPCQQVAQVNVPDVNPVWTCGLEVKGTFDCKGECRDRGGAVRLAVCKAQSARHCCLCCACRPFWVHHLAAGDSGSFSSASGSGSGSFVSSSSSFSSVGGSVNSVVSSSSSNMGRGNAVASSFSFNSAGGAGGGVAGGVEDAGALGPGSQPGASGRRLCICLEASAGWAWIHAAKQEQPRCPQPCQVGVYTALAAERVLPACDCRQCAVCQRQRAGLRPEQCHRDGCGTLHPLRCAAQRAEHAAVRQRRRLMPIGLGLAWFVHEICVRLAEAAVHQGTEEYDVKLAAYV